MDDLSEKLAGILNDPDSMARVRQMAESLLGDGEQKSDNTASAPSLFSEGMPSADEMRQIMGIMSKLKSSSNDSRSQLLLSLKPHLSKPRREKVDTAIKILKIIELLPYLRETGLLNL